MVSSNNDRRTKCKIKIEKMAYKRFFDFYFPGIICTGLAVISGATASPIAFSRNDVKDDVVNQRTLRQVTVLMRHGERAPVDTYPNDPYINSTMDPYGWGQLTNKGRLDVYNAGYYLRDRYDKFLGKSYSPDKFWLQSTSSDRTKMTAMILASSLWKPDYEQMFKSEIPWQPVTLHYWNRLDDRLLIIWNACPKLTMERLLVDGASEVEKFNEKNRGMYEEIEKFTGKAIETAEDLADLYGTLKAESVMPELELPYWTKEFFPDEMLPAVLLSYRMNVFNDELKKLAGGPFIKKTLRKMEERQSETIKPKDRRMFAYIAHDSTLVNVLSALGVWDGRAPDYQCMLIIELHEENGEWNVHMFEKNGPDYETRPLKLPGCGAPCSLDKFGKLVEKVIPGDYKDDCNVPDPNYVIPPAPPA